MLIYRGMESAKKVYVMQIVLLDRQRLKRYNLFNIIMCEFGFKSGIYICLEKNSKNMRL